MKSRCAWCENDPIYTAYHDDQFLFEFLILEGAQAGLSWITILKKRQNYRKAFHNFDFECIAEYTDTDAVCLLADSGIVCNLLKVNSAIKNVRATLDV